jgi:hypothetical protein
MGNFIRYCLENNIKLLIIPPHCSHLLQPLDLATFSPLKTLLSEKLRCVKRMGIYRFKRHKWLLAYAVVRPIAFRASNIAAGFCQSSLIPYAPSSVLRRLPPEPKLHQSQFTKHEQASSRRTSCRLLQNATLTGPWRHVANAAVQRLLSSEKPLKCSAKYYFKRVEDCVELLQT